MLIDYIQIINWRSFYGENAIEVSTDPEKNVTLIRAENGVGKTSLLAAVNWCFFGILPSESEFENPKKLVNEFAAENDGITTAKVQIDFVHQNRTYRASRSYEQKTETSHPLSLCEVSDGGEVPVTFSRPDRFINTVIPREMSPHFFFYGEATSRYTGTSGAKKFGEAVKGILGATVAGMALSDLQKAFKDYNRQAADNTSVEAREAENDIEKIDERIDRYRIESSKCDEEIDAAEGAIDRLNQELSGAKPAKDLQAKRGRLESRLATKDVERIKALDRQKNWMSDYATSILAEELANEADAVIKQEDTRGKLPAPYDQKFVDEILEDGTCICGRPIEQESAEYDKVKTLLDTAGDQAVMSRVMSTSNALGRLIEKSDRAWSDFERNNKDLQNLENEISGIDADILEISKELSENPVTDIAEKEAARERAKSNRKKATERKVEIQAAAKGLERQKTQIETELRALTQKSEAARRYVKRAQLSAALTSRLEERLKKEEENARVAIEREIDDIVQKFMRKPASVKLDKDYQLRLYDERNAEIPKSTGENQLLGLAFTGAIAKYAKERGDEISDILLPGTIAPLVVDSPFGHLDPIYRKGVAEFLPNLASQVILLVSTSQASAEVMSTLKEKIGMEYILTRNNRSDGSNKQSETINIRGKTYDLTLYNSEIEGTLIAEVAV
tara:strand:+ start:847 stop:2880 length:2034 start_codon:yes stop_codon:yes gene_type:complete